MRCNSKKGKNQDQHKSGIGAADNHSAESINGEKSPIIEGGDGGCGLYCASGKNADDREKCGTHGEKG